MHCILYLGSSQLKVAPGLIWGGWVVRRVLGPRLWQKAAMVLAPLVRPFFSGVKQLQGRLKGARPAAAA